jgi:vacuolar-type H+-ATPase subunit H
MEGFTESGILTPEEIDNLFTEVPEEKEEKQNAPTEEKGQETTEVNPDTLFEQPESVGSEEKNEEQEGTTSNKESTSPNKNFYSSITKALMDDSIFTDLNPDEITSAEDFAGAIEKQVQNRLDERQKRIDEVLNAGVEPD